MTYRIFVRKTGRERKAKYYASTPIKEQAYEIAKELRKKYLFVSVYYMK